MTHLCQLTEIPIKDFPELFQFYHYFPEKYPFLLSTTSQNKSDEQNSSFDILFIEPDEWLKLDHDLKLSASAQYEIAPQQSFLQNFDGIFKAENQSVKAQVQADANYHSLPFSGGWFVFFAYELAQQIEPCLNLPLSKQDTNQCLPIAYAARIRKALIIDHQQDKLFFLTESGLDHSRAFDDLLIDVQAIKINSACEPPEFNPLASDLYEEKEDIFLSAVKKVRNYIKEGDVFQVNLSRYWQTYITQESHQESFSRQTSYLYQLLSKANPAPFSGIAQFSNEQGSASIISSSPERLLKIKNNQLESRPIAGTRPRSNSMEEDLRLLEELHKHPKEQAEHIMLIDLIRNDLGKVCVPGTVKVNELMVNETYAHVHHIVSNVIGQLQQGIFPGEVIKALFPGGTITGCPKVRCMEIIAELENQPRGAYTGSMGYINLDGSMDLNILIRTMVLEQNTAKQSHEFKHKLSFRAGAGLVFDSIADRELQETRAKAMGLVRALQ